jgi:hypothetical protein
MKIICFTTIKEGVTMNEIGPFIPEETAHLWKLWKKGIVRENYAYADKPGVVIVMEVKNSSEGMEYLYRFPLTKAGMIVWTAVPVVAPWPLEAMFNQASLERVAIPDSEQEWAQELASK